MVYSQRHNINWHVLGLHPLLPICPRLLDQLHHRPKGRRLTAVWGIMSSHFRSSLAGCLCSSSSSSSSWTSSTVSGPTPPHPDCPSSMPSTPTWWPASLWYSAPSLSMPSSSPSSLWSLIRMITISTVRDQIWGTRSAWFSTPPGDWTNSQSLSSHWASPCTTSTTGSSWTTAPNLSSVLFYSSFKFSINFMQKSISSEMVKVGHVHVQYTCTGLLW